MIILIFVIFQVAALEAAINAGNKTSEKEFLVLTELLMSQLLKLDGIEAEGEAKSQRKAEVVFMPLKLFSSSVNNFSIIVFSFFLILCNLLCFLVSHVQ
jgi:hypothetical protein